MNLNQVTVPATNIPRSIAFYQILGLKLIVHTNDDYARFECPGGDATFSLHRVLAPSAETNGIWVYFEVANVDETIESIKKQGVQVEAEPVDQTWLWREARIRDPDGNQIIVYSAGKNRKNPPWRLKEDQL
jgi:predicted enzyme related to lactoylglutathione lyase